MTAAAAVARTPPASAPQAAKPDPAAGHRGRDREQHRVQSAGQWPPERTAAVRLARARDTVTRAAATGDPRAQALARRHIDAVEADARTYLSRPADISADRDEQAASARARAGLARMLDPDPVTRAAGTDDMTRAWPAEHLDLLRAWAEAAQRTRTDPDGDRAADRAADDDAVARARHAVASIPTADASVEEVGDGLDPDVALGRHPHREPDADDHTDGDQSGSAGADADSWTLSTMLGAGR